MERTEVHRHLDTMELLTPTIPGEFGFHHGLLKAGLEGMLESRKKPSEQFVINAKSLARPELDRGEYFSRLGLDTSKPVFFKNLNILKAFDVLREAAEDEHPDERLVRLGKEVKKALDRIANGPSESRIPLLKFLAKLSSVLGASELEREGVEGALKRRSEELLRAAEWASGERRADPFAKMVPTTELAALGWIEPKPRVRPYWRDELLTTLLGVMQSLIHRQEYPITSDRSTIEDQILKMSQHTGFTPLRKQLEEFFTQNDVRTMNKVEFASKLNYFIQSVFDLRAKETHTRLSRKWLLAELCETLGIKEYDQSRVPDMLDKVNEALRRKGEEPIVLGGKHLESGLSRIEKLLVKFGAQRKLDKLCVLQRALSLTGHEPRVVEKLIYQMNLDELSEEVSAHPATGQVTPDTRTEAFLQEIEKIKQNREELRDLGGTVERLISRMTRKYGEMGDEEMDYLRETLPTTLAGVKHRDTETRNLHREIIAKSLILEKILGGGELQPEHQEELEKAIQTSLEHVSKMHKRIVRRLKKVGLLETTSPADITDEIAQHLWTPIQKAATTGNHEEMEEDIDTIIQINWPKRGKRKGV